ncbi:hypothetical protein RvY_08807 [Ramazzottius varieornatus]|uniref:Importin N-terminal domain-containing protein n=1 Tax=Ramazzottius varieornatus TaxID=947166 RepID=A0A1D1V761_RAMVA|nr:hypothetical protein RvY_08807 [Ramazzottius varieornatus]
MEVEASLTSSQAFIAPQEDLNLPHLTDALRLCTDGLNPDKVQAGERILQMYINNKQFLTALVAVLTDDALPNDVRTMAAILCRNNIEKFWRAGPLMLDEKDKRNVRNRMFFACFAFPATQATNQLLAGVGKIARFDFPRTWPTLIDEIGCKLAVDDEEVKFKSLKLLHESTKELATKRMPADRKAFCEMSTNIFSPVTTVFHGTLSSVLSGPITGDFVRYNLHVRQCLYAAKVLQTLMMHGIREYTKFAPFSDYWSSIANGNVIASLLSWAVNLENQEEINQDFSEVIRFIRKIAVRIQQTILSMMEEHPLSMAPHLLPLMRQIIPLAFGESGQLNLPERSVVTAMNIIKVFHSEQEYRIRDEKPGVYDHIRAIRSAYFNQGNILQMIEQLITRHLLLTQSDLDRIGTDSEEYANEIDGFEDWKFSHRASAEALLTALCYSNQDISATKILSLVTAATTTPGVATLFKEAVYLAAGIAAFHLFDMLDFDQLFRNHLWVEFQDKSNGNIVIRRRIVWLVGTWSAVRMSDESRAAVFQLLVDAMTPKEHLSVRLMAAKSVKSFVDVYEFRVEDVTPVAPALFDCLLQLITECSSDDSRLTILSSLNIALERMEAQVAPFLSKVLECLMSLWKESSESHLIQSGVVSAIKMTVHALRREAASIEPFACELIAVSTDLSNPHSIHLLQDGLELWNMLLQHSQQATPNLQKLLVERLPQLLEVTSENMALVMDIVENCILIAPDLVFAGFFDNFVSWAAVTIPTVKDEGLDLIIKVLDYAVQVCQASAVPKMTSVLAVLISTLPSDGNCSFGLKMGFLARCLYYNFPAFTPAFTAVAEGSNNQTNAVQVFHEFMTLWMDQINWISKLERKKLCALAFMNMLVLNPDLMAPHFAGIVYGIIEVVGELSDYRPGGGDADSSLGEYDILNLSNEDAGLSDGLSKSLMMTGSFDEIRRHDLRIHNICFNNDISKVMKEKWRELIGKTGDAFVQQLWNTLDSDSSAKFKVIVG